MRFYIDMAFAVVALVACNGHASSVIPSTGAGGILGGARAPKTVTGAAYVAAVLSDSPIAYYRMSDTLNTAADSGVNSLNGTYGSNVRKGMAGLLLSDKDGASSFPGGAWAAASIITVPANALLQPRAVSVEAWVYEAASNATGGFIDLVSYGSQAGQGYSLQLDPANKPHFFMNTTSGAGYIDVTSSVVLSPNVAYHLVGTYDGVSANIYVNGVSVGSSPGAGVISYAGIKTFGLSIGGGQDTGRTVASAGVCRSTELSEVI